MLELFQSRRCNHNMRLVGGKGKPVRGHSCCSMCMLLWAQGRRNSPELAIRLARTDARPLTKFEDERRRAIRRTNTSMTSMNWALLSSAGFCPLARTGALACSCRRQRSPGPRPSRSIQTPTAAQPLTDCIDTRLLSGCGLLSRAARLTARTTLLALNFGTCMERMHEAATDWRTSSPSGVIRES